MAKKAIRGKVRKPKRRVVRSDDEYRELKKILNKYHKFSFNLPRKNSKKGLSPAQKRAITRKYNEISRFIRDVEKDRSSFITYKKGDSAIKKMGYEKTNKGIFFPRPLAKVRRKKGELIIVSEYKKRKDFFLPLPNEIYTSPGLIPAWLESMYDKYYPADFSISIKGYRGGFSWRPENGLLYFTNAFDFFSDGGRHKNAINGIYVTTYTLPEFEELYGEE